jgi:long-chain acyl-CoA synthetase
VFKEYYKDPEATAEAIDKEGWFHTGDLGSFDAEGYLSITGRKKDIIITAGGKNVAPQRVEEILLQSPYFNQIVILGDQEKYLAALIVLNEHKIKEYLKGKNINVGSGKKLSELAEVNSLIELEITRLSANLGRYEQVKAFHILDNELTIENGELTPTLKIKRNVIRAKYREFIKPLFNKPKDS